ncbi:MAG: amidohydrolase [Candidatus Didemnitutus sp.]|nr:amidohydrolase [Candidatus Didemnitutus sp.]
MLRALLLATTLTAAAFAQPVDLLLVNGNIHTLDATQPHATALAVRAGRIVFVGDDASAAAFRATARRTIDLRGATVVPGLTDAHIHLEGIGARELTFDLEGTASVADLQARLAARVAQTHAKQWIVGRGWIETHWQPPVFPTRAALDAVAPDHPVVLTRADGHALVANSLALRLAKVDAATPNPSGGEVLKDAAGEPTGVLVDHAMRLVTRLIPPATAAETERALIVGAAREGQLGWTSVHVAGQNFATSEMVRRLVAEGKIKLRIFDAVSGSDGSGEKLLAAGLVVGESDGRYTRRGVKLYMDGALGSRGAALLEPYADYASTGLLLQDEAKFAAFLVAALRGGVQVQTHAIGDRGNRVVLDAYKKAFAAVPPGERAQPDPRWRIEHAQIIHPDDLGRFAALGVIASMQPSHAIGDLFFAPRRLGRERLVGAYAWRSLLDSGAIIASGSDAPVERGEPMIEFYAAVARRSLDGFANEDWHLAQRMTRLEALRAMTLDAAYAAFAENEWGSLVVGKWADLTVLSADIMTIPEPEILQTKCLLTVIGGEVVFDASNP